jgi:V/A-type H+-transporting ATPase subunit D
VSAITPTRAVVLELQDEQRAMREGHVFLDEKCLLLAGEMLRQLAEHGVLQQRLRQAHEAAVRALRAAIGRHGLEGLQCQGAAPQGGARGRTDAGTLMGVRLQQAVWTPDTAPAPEGVAPSPEVREARRAFVELMAAAAPLAAVSGNLERLSQEYRRSVRRARALQDVLLPELGRDIADIQTRIEELEQQDAIAMRRGALGAAR